MDVGVVAREQLRVDDDGGDFITALAVSGRRGVEREPEATVPAAGGPDLWYSASSATWSSCTRARCHSSQATVFASSSGR